MVEVSRIGLTLALLALLVGPGRAADLGAAQSAAVAGDRAYEAGELEEAAAQYTLALEQGLDHAVVHYNLGNAWFRQGQVGRAIASYERALRRNPRDAAARANLDEKTRRGQYAEVQELISQNFGNVVWAFGSDVAVVNKKMAYGKIGGGWEMDGGHAIKRWWMV